jgi:hypothetical protein
MLPSKLMPTCCIVRVVSDFPQPFGGGDSNERDLTARHVWGPQIERFVDRLDSEHIVARRHEDEHRSP